MRQPSADSPRQGATRSLFGIISSRPGHPIAHGTCKKNITEAPGTRVEGRCPLLATNHLDVHQPDQIRRVNTRENRGFNPGCSSLPELLCEMANLSIFELNRLRPNGNYAK